MVRPVSGSKGTGRARGYSWSPATKGNLLALRHGASSPRKVSARAAELVAGLLVDRPDLADYPEAVAAWSRAEARCALLDEWITDHGLLTEDGSPTTGALKYVSSWETQAAVARARLGLDPRAEAELARERVDARRSVIDLEAIAERGRAVVAVRRAELASAENDAAAAADPEVPGGAT